MKLRSLLGATAIAAATIFSATAIATPEYNGNTFGIEIQEADKKPAGYYIWNDANDARNWSIRWFGTGATESEPTWFGSITFENGALGSKTDFSFESGDSSSVTVLPNFVSNALGWNASTDNAGEVDGIDFTLTSDTEKMTFSLGSSLFTGLDLGDDLASTGIFIGGNVDEAIVDVFSPKGSPLVVQNFEIQVVEPSTLGLAGLALAGLALVRRKRA